jgi:hypothetical protein
MRKQVLAVSVLLLCLAVLALVVVWQRPRPAPGVTLENFRRLHKGMTEVQVEAILGAPRYVDDEAVPDTRISIFEDSDYSANVHFLNDGGGYLPEGACYGVVWKHGDVVGMLRPKPATFLEWMHSWLPWSKPEMPDE